MLSHAGHRGPGNMRKCGIRLRQRQQFIDAAYALGGDNTELAKGVGNAGRPMHP
jgi:hypothetical protein